MNNIYKSGYIYFRENYFKKPKQIFKFVSEQTKITDEDCILDIGCARGEFLYYLRKKKKLNSRMYGLDQDKDLIVYAKTKSPNIKTTFYCKDFLKFKTKKKFSKIFVLGVIECFDDLDNFVKKISKISNANALIFLFCKSNDNNIDVVSNYLNKVEKKNWQITSFWSHKTLLEKFKKYNFKFKSKKSFSLPFNLKKNKDPIRSFTLKTEYGKFFANGFEIFNLNLYVFKKK